MVSYYLFAISARKNVEIPMNLTKDNNSSYFYIDYLTNSMLY
jgi:hypothetical protein